jgi:hypothetical protein
MAMGIGFFASIALADTQTDQSNENLWTKLWGKPTPSALYLGMATYHLSKSRRDDRWNNNLVGGSYNGYFAGTLQNSFDDRAFVLGVERLWAIQHLSENIDNQIGYRLGLISGYDERMTNIAEHTPVLPFPQVFDNIMLDERVGLQLSWSMIVFSAGFVVQF